VGFNNYTREEAYIYKIQTEWDTYHTLQWHYQKPFNIVGGFIKKTYMDNEKQTIKNCETLLWY